MKKKHHPLTNWKHTLVWRVEVSKSAAKELKKIGKSNSLKVVSYLREIEKLDNPRLRGKELKGNLRSFWRYRVGDYRVICEIKDGELVVLALRVGHRKNVYD